jgi:hypothetical protein
MHSMTQGRPLIVAGVDSHADTHHVAALDQRGALLASTRFLTTPETGVGTSVVTAPQAQPALGEDVHRACDDEPEKDQRDQRLHAHDQLGPMPQRHNVGRAERSSVC